MKITSKVAIAVLTITPPSLADVMGDDSVEGTPCATSSECGGLKCIDGSCHDVSAIMRGERPRWSGTFGHGAMFGSGEGYGAIVAAADIAAIVTEPFFMLATVSSGAPVSSVLGVVCFVPVGFAGPIAHLIHGRVLPAIISFFAWTSLAATTFVVGGLFGLGFEHGFEFNSVAAWTGGLAFGAAGAATLTWLDVWMARTVTLDKKRPGTTSLQLSPSIIPTRRGAMASVVLSF